MQASFSKNLQNQEKFQPACRETQTKKIQKSKSHKSHKVKLFVRSPNHLIMNTLAPSPEEESSAGMATKKPFSTLRVQADLRTKKSRNRILKSAGFKVDKLDAYAYHQEDCDDGQQFQVKMFFCKDGETIDEASYFFQVKISQTLTDEDLKHKKPLQHFCDPEEHWYVIHLFMENLSCLSHREIQQMYLPVKVHDVSTLYSSCI